jgi:hypothetical protein
MTVSSRSGSRYRITDISYFTEAYFELVDKYPGIGRYLAAKLEMVICVDDAVYRIRE